MYIYFVRHGSTTLGEERRYQFPDDSLSELGRRQSQLIADRWSNFDFDIIISSPYKRAIETADIINAHRSSSIIVSDLFQETKQPGEIEGKSRDDPLVIHILEQVSVNWEEDGRRYSDEETFIELRGRGIKALEYLTKINKKKILVVTHGDILRVMVSIILHGEEISPSLFNAFRVFALIKNTGVTVCYYGLTKQSGNTTKRWYLISWNDHAHLEK